MKKILISLLSLALAASACDSYFDIDFQDQATMEEIFAKAQTTRSYLSHLYAFIPHEEDTHTGTGFVIPRSDEGLFGFLGYGPFNKLRTGDYGTAAKGDIVTYNYWNSLYIGINQCSIFMDYVDLDREDTQRVKDAMRAEARFLRAYYYFCLLRQYGPVIVWGDRRSPEDVNGEELDRNTVDQNVDFIVTELDKAMEFLPDEISEIGDNPNSWMGRATRSAAMALKARVLLYAASPLFNGQNGTGIYDGMTNHFTGERIFPEYDATKWDKAAKAAKDILDEGRFSLCKPSAGETPIQRAASAYQNVFFERWNSETIWGWWNLGIGHSNGGFATWIGATGSYMYCTIPNFPETTTSYRPLQAYTPSLKMVDAYPMEESGRYPVVGYKKNGKLNDLSQPLVDEKSGYATTGWVEGYRQPVDADWAPAFKAHRTTVGRDARYYASLVPDGFYWPSSILKKRWTHYNAPDATVPTTGHFESAGINWVGYICRRYYKADTPQATGQDFTGAMRYVYPTFRLAEVLLSYAEACNEKPERDVPAALDAINQVRARAGLNKLEEAYREIDFTQADAAFTIGGVTRTAKEWLRWMILQERWCEFGMEAMRHYDMCRWMRAKDEYPSQPWTLNMAANTYEDLYTRVNNVMPLENAAFEDRDYFYPIISSQLSEMVNFTQNYGF